MQTRQDSATRQTLHTLWTWLMLSLCATLALVVMAPLYVLTAWQDGTRRRVGLVFRRAARTAAQLSPQWSFGAVAPYPPSLVGAHVVVSNHESHLDAFLMTFLPYEMKWLAKKSLFRIPVIGWCMQLAGDIAVSRGKGTSIGQAMLRCRRYLSQGMPVFIFPEGTRATSEAMLPFKDGAFRLALEAGCPILPVAVAGTARGLRKNSWRFYPSKALVQVGAPISTATLRAQIDDPTSPMTLLDATTLLKEETRACISQMRAQLRERLGLVVPVPHAPQDVA